MIQLAKPAQLPEIKQLTEACAHSLQQLGIFQWNENYPSLNRLQQDIDNEELYLFMEQNEVLGIVALSTQMDEVYKPVNWLTHTSNHLYIHRLAVRPDKWGRGIATKLMDFAENFAQTLGCNSIRLDTFSQNKRNQKFYDARGYFKLEDIYFPEKSEHPFHCYELIL